MPINLLVCQIPEVHRFRHSGKNTHLLKQHRFPRPQWFVDSLVATIRVNGVNVFV